jgi:hypothetical protein
VGLPRLHSFAWELKPRLRSTDPDEFALQQPGNFPWSLSSEEQESKRIGYICAHVLASRKSVPNDPNLIIAESAFPRAFLGALFKPRDGVPVQQFAFHCPIEKRD